MTSKSARMHDDNHSGSSSPGEPEFLVVGKLGRPHGMHGEIVLDVYTDFPERLKPGVKVYLGPQFQPLQITRRRPHSRGMLLYFDGYQTREQVSELRNLLVHVLTVDRPQLPEGEFYHHQLLGLEVIDENDARLGWVTEILETGANEVYIVEDSDGSELLIPAIESVILDIDLASNRIQVHLLPGLLQDKN